MVLTGAATTLKSAQGSAGGWAAAAGDTTLKSAHGSSAIYGTSLMLPSGALIRVPLGYALRTWAGVMPLGMLMGAAGAPVAGAAGAAGSGGSHGVTGGKLGTTWLSLAP